MPTYENTGYRTEWWIREPYYTAEEVADAERIAAKRGDVVTDEHVGHGRPGMTVLKHCSSCGELWAPQFGAKTCNRCRQAKAAAASANARRGKAAAR